MDEQNPERKKEPNNQEDAQEDYDRNGKSKRKFFKDLFNIPFHSYPIPPLINSPPLNCMGQSAERKEISFYAPCLPAPPCR
jgi:hypothetical protein